MTSEQTLLGFPRKDGNFGVRNHVLVVPSVFCTNEISQRIARHYAGKSFGEHGENKVVVLHHGVGCCNVGIDEGLAYRVIRNSILNPNIGAVVAVSLGCGQLCTACGSGGDVGEAGRLTKGLADHKPLTEVVVHANGGTEACFERAVAAIEGHIADLEQQKREPFPFSKLAIGVMNGSSDATSGLFTNPAVGHFSDWLVEHGGRIFFSQTIETLGGETMVTDKLDTTDGELVERTMRLFRAVTSFRQAVEKEGVQSEPTPGNIRQGLSTLAEKSIGSIFKIGHKAENKLVGLVPHGKLAGEKAGIYLVDGPGQDIICMTGLSAAGAQIVLFTTGGGTPTGSGVSPTVKLTSNRQTYNRMRPNIDLCLPVEDIFLERNGNPRRSLQEIAIDSIVPFVKDVAEGRTQTCAEKIGQNDFHVRQMWMTD